MILLAVDLTAPNLEVCLDPSLPFPDRAHIDEVFFAFVRYLNHSSLSLAYLIMFLVLARGKLYIHTFSSKFISPDPA